ncbi:MAG: coproporphyrinogen dehydrogenase HemZ [Oscillospiraceae bacterium]|nr:coproporphyrinogen dehydrogenase HemZ [Oscillospiraceae bacterium]
MTLTLIGHDRRFAVEQAALNYFPREGGGHAVSRLSHSGRLASAAVEYGGKKARGRAWVPPDAPPDGALRMAFYRAARQLIEPPPWGALTGIRPVKKLEELADSLSGSERGGERIPGPPAFEKAARELTRRYDVSPVRAGMAADCAASAAPVRDRLGEKDVALYIGIPFCPTRCAYCSFVSSSVERDAGLTGRYVETLLEEIALAGETVSRLGLRVRALYWGGGTPAVLSPEQFSSLCGAVRACFPLEFLEEHTVEAGRPDAVTPEKLAAYREGGAARVSVNPQTLREDVLDAIGRRHTPEQFWEAYGQARRAGFDTVNVDLIAGLPGDGTEGFLSGLERILAAAPENITVHTLARKRASRVAAEALPVCPARTVGEMLDGAGERLRKNGYAPYYLYRQKFTEGGFENTGWTKPGKACLYNLCMMEELCSVLSLGAGGVTKWVGKRIERLFHCKYPLEYIGRRDTMGDILTAFEGLYLKNGRTDG